MRLLLDEMYPPVLAEQLHARGHDVSAVTTRAELRAMADDDVFAIAQQEHRVVATENIGDFVSIADRADERGEAHFGLILIDPVKYRRGRQPTIGRLVTALDRLLSRYPDDRPTSPRHWL